MSATRELRRRMRGLRSLLWRSKGYPNPHWLALAFHSSDAELRRSKGEVLKLLGIWRGASFACESATGFGKPSKGAPHGDEITCFAAHAGRVDSVDRGSSFHSFSEGRTGQVGDAADCGGSVGGRGRRRGRARL